jgi:hypothetical protein
MLNYRMSSSQDTIKKVKKGKLFTEKKVFTICVIDKGLLSRIHKELEINFSKTINK